MLHVEEFLPNPKAGNQPSVVHPLLLIQYSVLSYPPNLKTIYSSSNLRMRMNHGGVMAKTLIPQNPKHSRSLVWGTFSSTKELVLTEVA
jgi:hypothetical protein